MCIGLCGIGIGFSDNSLLFFLELVLDIFKSVITRVVLHLVLDISKVCIFVGDNFLQFVFFLNFLLDDIFATFDVATEALNFSLGL